MLFLGSTSFNSLGVSLVAQRVKNLPAMLETWVRSLGWKIPWRREWLPTPVFLPGEFYGQRNLEDYKAMELQRVRHRLSDLTLAASLILGYLTLPCTGQATLILLRSTLSCPGEKGPWECWGGTASWSQTSQEVKEAASGTG